MDTIATVASSLSDVARKKARAAEIRARARTLFEAGTPAIPLVAALCEAIDHLLLDFLMESLAQLPPAERLRLGQNAAMIAVGGTGRGELAPCSDIDLLFLYQRRVGTSFHHVVTQIVQSCWDAKYKLGHSVRTLGECLAMARQEPQVATALVEARLLWGSEDLFRQLRHKFRRNLVDGRHLPTFIDNCILARAADWPATGPAQELEPDVKGSLGGLRDLHLIRWIGYGAFGVRDLDSLRLAGALNFEDVRRLRGAWEFLTRIRVDMHLDSGRPQDRLTRDEQLRIAASRGFPGTPAQSPVEQFMQEYFRHSRQLAAISRRFATLHRPRTLLSRVSNYLVSHRSDGILRVGPERIDVRVKHLPRICASTESMLRLYTTAALYGVLPAPEVTEAIAAAVPRMSKQLSAESAGLFFEILRCTKSLGPILRSMFDTGLLDVVIPDMAHARCLMQFNLYHHYTVDEHTLRAVETATSMETDEGPLGSAYRAIRHKEILHLALLLHDLGKGFAEDHSEVGQRIAERTAVRLGLSPAQREQLVFLVHKHLDMAHLALRRDITDPVLLLQFSHQVGTPDTLRQFYVLSAADIMAVGPGTWTSWKAELLTDLFDRCSVILSGKHYTFHEQERLDHIKSQVTQAIVPTPDVDDALEKWIERQLSGLSAHYLTSTPPQRIAADLDLIRQLAADDIEIAGRYEQDTRTVEYRVLTKSPRVVPGCFYKMTGVLAALRMEILSADINTAPGHVVVDSFRVLDRDFDREVPPSRIEQVADHLRTVLRGETTVESLFQKYQRFGGNHRAAPAGRLPTRVLMDNDSSDNRTIIDVFAHDRPGLLYTLARTIHELGLSVDLAKISTHFDQVVDVFYVTESDGRKVTGDQRLSSIRETLLNRLIDFEDHGHRAFVA